MKITTRYFLASFCTIVSAISSLFAQPATITVKANNELLKNLQCYWVEDNFEFVNYTPLEKDTAARNRNWYTIPFDKGMEFRYVTLQVKDDNNSNKLALYDYLICPGDEITISYNGTEGLLFRGKGAEKFDLQYNLSKIENTVFLLNKPVVHTLSSPKQKRLPPVLYDKLSSLLQYNYAKRDSQLSILNGYKAVLDSSLYSLIKLNIIGRTEQTLLKHMFMEFYRLSHKYPELKMNKLQLLESYMERDTRLNGVSDRNALYANELQLYFVERMKFQNWLEYVFTKEWEGKAINKAFMDRVLYRHFYRNYSKIDSVQRQEIVNQITGAKYKKAVQNFLKNIAYGTKMPNFTLQDTLGNIVHFADFAGKTIVLDFWYTGCGNCRVLNENMKPIKETLKSKKDLIFANVSIDPDFENWKKSVRTGAYTDTSDVSLYTMGKKSSHPLVKFFNVMSYPRQVIIDREMRIVETHVPRVGTEENNKAFLDLIARLND